MCTIGRLQTLNCFYVWVCEGMCVSWWHFKWDQTPSDWKVAVSRKQMNWRIFVGSLTAIQACWGCTCVLGRLRTSSCFKVTAAETAGPGSLSLYPPPHLSRYADSTSELEMLRGILSHQAFSPISPISHPTRSAAHWGRHHQQRIHRCGWRCCHARHLSRCCCNVDFCLQHWYLTLLSSTLYPLL